MPPVTGPYEFWIAADDQREFWLSTDTTQTKRVRRSSQPDWALPREWDKFPEQK